MTAAADTTRGRRRVSPGVALTVAYLACVAGLIALRAFVERLDFLSLGWIMVLSVVPLLPWLVPALSPLAGRVAPFVRQVKLPGGIEISLSGAASPVASLGAVERVLTDAHLVSNVTATAAPLTTSETILIVEGVRGVRAARAEAVSLDLGDGRKWRLPNLYFLAWLLANDPVVRWLVFVEDRAPDIGVFVGVCDAAALKSRVEAAHPEYSAVAPQLVFADPARPENVAALTNEFNRIRAAVAPDAAGEVPTLRWLTSADVRDLLGPDLVTTSIRWTDRLDRAGLEAVLSAPVPYVPATTEDGRFRGLVEQRAVALAFGRRVLQEA